MQPSSDTSSPATHFLPSPVQGVSFFIAYVLCAVLGAQLSIPSLHFISFWLPGGLFLGVLLKIPTRAWSAYIVLAILANLIFNTLNHQSLILSAAFTTGNVLSAVFAAALIRRFDSYYPRLERITEVSKLIVAVMIGASVSAGIGNTAMDLADGDSHAFSNWVFWWSGDVLGMLLLTPLLLSTRVSVLAYWRGNPWYRHIELLALLLTASLFSVISFGPDSLNAEFGAAYLVIACMLWSAIRFDMQVVSLVNLLMAILIIIDSKHYADNVTGELLQSRSILLQALLATSMFVGFFLAALLNERRTQEQRLTERNFWLAESQRIAHVGTWSWEPENDTIIWSEELFRIFGVLPHAFVPTLDGLLALVHADDRDALRQWLDACRSSGAGRDFEFRATTPDGRLRFLSCHAEWQAASRSHAARMVGIMQDVSERARAAAALRESESKFESVFRRLPIWIAIRNLKDSTYVEINEQALHDLGYTREEFIGRSTEDLEFLSIEDRSRVQQLSSSDGGFTGLEVTVVSKDGRRRQMLANGERITLGGQPCLLTVAVDISARRLLEEELNEYAGQLRLFIESSPVALAMFDLDMRYLQVSRGWRDTFALGDRELYGQSHYEIFPDIPSQWRDVHQRGLRGEVISSEQDRYERAGGQVHWVRWEVRPWRQADDSIGGIVIFTEDITARKQAQAAVIERDAMLQQVGEVARVGATMLDLSTHEYYWSSAMFSIHEVEGNKPPDPDHCIDFFTPEVRPTVNAALEELKMRGTPFDMEVPVVTARGNRIWVRVQGSPVYEEGKVVKILGAYQDITTTKQAELELRASEARFRTLISNLQVGVVVQDANAEVILCNPMCLQLLGLTEDQLLGKTSFDAQWNIIREDGSVVTGAEQPAPQVIANGKPIYGLVLGVYRPATRDRVWLQVDAQPEFNADGSLKQVTCTFGDITARKQAEMALRESEERFRQIAENIHEVFWVYDIALRAVTYVSPAYEKIWGHKVADVYQDRRDWINAVVAEDRQRLKAALDRLPREGGFAETYRIIRPDGKMRWIRDQGFAVYDAQGNLIRVVGTAQDITEAREIENQLRQSQRLESIGTLTGGIAHDFNNILAGILGFTALVEQVIEQPDINRAELKAYLAHIGRAGRRASDLITQILTFSRAGSPNFTSVNMGDVVGEAVKLLRAAIPSSIQFEVQMFSTPPPILGNASQLHQVIMNLGTNAWHAMREQKGQLSITLDSAVIDEAEGRMLSNIAAGEYVRLSVKDTGCGMSTETVDRIFEPFFTTKPAGQGTGLGLSVVHGIVRSHRGAIRVHSALYRGTTFEIFFPVYAEPQRTAGNGHGARSIVHGHGQRILFVDDESALVLLGEHTLQRLGYEVTGETSALNALKTFEKQPGAFDLVVTDQTMPGMTGLELATRIHSMRPTLPVILVSGYAAAISNEQMRTAGISQILNKPYSNERLADVIHQQFVSRE